VPLSTLLRGIVLERETRLKEQLLIMGTSPQVTAATTYGVKG